MCTRKQSIGSERLGIRENIRRTNNTSRQLLSLTAKTNISNSSQSLHIFYWSFTSHSMNDRTRLIDGLNVRRPKTQQNIVYQILPINIWCWCVQSTTVGHSVGAHADALARHSDDASNDCDSGNEQQTTNAADASTPTAALHTPSPTTSTTAAPVTTATDSLCEMCFYCSSIWSCAGPLWTRSLLHCMRWRLISNGRWLSHLPQS